MWGSFKRFFVRFAETDARSAREAYNHDCSEACGPDCRKRESDVRRQEWFYAFMLGRPFMRLLAAASVAAGVGMHDTGGALAQETPPDIPDPSKLENQFDERKLPQSSIVIRGADEKAATAPDPNIRFVLNGVSLEGATAVSPATLASFYAPYVGQEISLGQLYGIAAEMTAYYRNEGYILSRVVVPAQSIEGGHVRLAVVEGFIGKISVEGDIAFGVKFLEAMAAKIRASKPLKAADLERYMLLTNDLPGVKAQAVLQASKDTPGATDLTIVVTEDRAAFFAAVNNRGSKYNGPVQVQAGVELNSVLGPMSKTGVRVIAATQTDEFKSAELRHQMFLGHEGLQLTLVGRHTRSKPGASLAELEIDSKSNSGNVSLSYPVIRTRAKSLYVQAGLDIRDTRTDILGDPFTRDKVRKATLGATLDFIDGMNGINLVNVELGKGLDILGGKETGAPNMSRPDAQSDFLKVNVSAMRLQRIVPRVSLLLDVTGQYTDYALVASEEIALGGSQYGRAFDPSEISGDRGIAGRAELRYDGTTDNKWLNRYQVYSFIDYGTVWDRTDSGNRSISLGSVGAGMRLTLTDTVSANFELATPIKKTADYDERWGGDVRGFFGLNLRF
ncbi:MAG: ShlB/FhaC/HecB family hemolysin secretion/activation protein [Alphaproteobacteria bacterium]|nr:MAG: ShlB/FhaC/HecB family hemolysin secretion/activation protein [Alphaproteobacteria bacterium]